MYIYSYNSNHYLLLYFYNGCRIFHIVVCKLRNMHQTLDVNTYIDEAALETAKSNAEKGKSAAGQRHYSLGGRRLRTAKLRGSSTSSPLR